METRHVPRVSWNGFQLVISCHVLKTKELIKEMQLDVLPNLYPSKGILCSKSQPFLQWMALNCQALLFFSSFCQLENAFVQQCFVCSSGRHSMFCLPIFLFAAYWKFPWSQAQFNTRICIFSNKTWSCSYLTGTHRVCHPRLNSWAVWWAVLASPFACALWQIDNLIT